jgi:hypothetical protein
MRILAGLLALLTALPSFAATPYALNGVMLLQPEPVLQERVARPEDLATYLAAVNAAAAQALAKEQPTPAAGFVVVAVRPGGESKVWLDFEPPLPAAVDARLRASLETIAPFRARIGVVVVALNASLWGAAPTTRAAPQPQEWRDAAKSSVASIEIGELVERIWPASAAGDTQAPAFSVPPDFEVQVLEPTGGRIARPKGWFYAQLHREGHLAWTLSREDSTQGPYLVGVMVQAIFEVRAKTKQSPSDFVTGFVEAKRASTQVQSECPERAFEPFKRRCIDTVEENPISPTGEFRILYSLLYNDDMDLVVLTIAGAPSNEWQQVSPLFNVMAEFELADLSRFATAR